MNKICIISISKKKFLLCPPLFFFPPSSSLSPHHFYLITLPSYLHIPPPSLLSLDLSPSLPLPFPFLPTTSYLLLPSSLLPNHSSFLPPHSFTPALSFYLSPLSYLYISFCLHLATSVFQWSSSLLLLPFSFLSTPFFHLPQYIK